MIPISEFIHHLRKGLDDEFAKTSESLMGGGAVNLESADETALRYIGAIGHLNGLKAARALIDELVKKVNEGGV